MIQPRNVEDARLIGNYGASGLVQISCLRRWGKWWFERFCSVKKMEFLIYVYYLFSLLDIFLRISFCSSCKLFCFSCKLFCSSCKLMNLIKNQIKNIKNNITSIILIKPLFVWLYHNYKVIEKEGKWQTCQKVIVQKVRLDESIWRMSWVRK